MRLSVRAGAMPASPIRKLAPLEADAVARGLRVHRLNIGQPDVATPIEMRRAIAAFDAPVLAYGPSEGLAEVREAIAGYLARIGQPATPRQVLVTVGGSEAILSAMIAVCDPGDEILVFEPFYSNFAGFANMSGARLVPVPTRPGDGYRPPPARVIESFLTPRTRALLYASPSNPTGTVLRRDEVRRLVDLAARHDLVVLADEAYREFVYDGAVHTGILDVAAEAGELGRVVLLDSLSKRFSACGARIGCLVAHDPGLLEACLRFGQARLCPPTVEQLAAVAGYRVLDRCVPPMVDEYRRRRDVVMDALRPVPGIVCTVPEGAFYVMPSLPIDDSDAFATFLLRDFSHDGATVMVAPGTGFYATPGKGRHEVRIAYVLDQGELRAAMDLLVRGLHAYNDRGP